MASVTGLIALKNCQGVEIPWVESLLSVQAICDHLIIVDGKSTDQTIEIIKSKLDSSRLTILEFDWPENSNWLQFARSYAYGKEFVKTDWVLFFTWDEIFPQWDFKKLDVISPDIHYVTNLRQYVLSPQHVYPYIKKENLFRNLKDITFGIVNYLEGAKANFRDFGRLINCSQWFDGTKLINIKDTNIPYQKDYLQLLQQGQIPKGYRDLKRVVDLGWEFYNTDVTFCSNEQILKRKTISYNNYKTLPLHYQLKSYPTDILETTRLKIRNMLQQKKKLQLRQLPYLKHERNLQNLVREECERVGIPWII